MFGLGSVLSTTTASTAACQPPYGCQPVDGLTERAVRIALRHPPSRPSVFGHLGESIKIPAYARDSRSRGPGEVSYAWDDANRLTGITRGTMPIGLPELPREPPRSRSVMYYRSQQLAPSSARSYPSFESPGYPRHTFNAAELVVPGFRLWDRGYRQTSRSPMNSIGLSFEERSHAMKTKSI